MQERDATAQPPDRGERPDTCRPEPCSLSPDREPEERLEELVFQCLERIEAEGPDAVEEICLRHAAQAGPLLARVRALLKRGWIDVPPAGEADASGPR